MSHAIGRYVPARPRDLLARLLDEPELVSAVRSLPPRAIGALVKHVGLEDCGEIIALATPEQITHVLDEDVWKADRPGGDEVFDAARFGVWLEILLEAGDDAAADKLADLPEDLVTLGFHRLVLVIDMDDLAVEIAGLDPDDADMVEKALDGCLYQEIDELRIVSRRHEAWDAAIGALLALDKNHHDALVRLLERLAAASRDVIEDEGGLCEALSRAEMIDADAEADREDRRAAQGFVSAANAQSFLALARTQPIDEVIADEKRDPVTRAYFRDLGRAPEPEREAPRARKLESLLRAAGIDPAPPLLTSNGGPGRVLRDAMSDLAARDPALHARRLEELAYLVNVLLAGAGVGDRPFRPFEAAETVVATCERGLRHLRSNRALGDTPADVLFRIGWKLRHEERREGASKKRKVGAGEQKPRHEPVNDAGLTRRPRSSGRP